MVSKIRVVAWNIQGDNFQEDSPHDAVSEFSLGANPNGVWSYGYSVESGVQRSLVPFDKGVQTTESQAWTRSDYVHSGTPAIWRNLTRATRFGVGPNQLSLHPGPRPNQDFAILRFTAPSPDVLHDPNLGPVYRVQGRFLAGDTGNMSASIAYNGKARGPERDVVLREFSTTSGDATFDLSLYMTTGDTLDFMVGNNGNFANGNTPIEVTVHVVTQLEKLGLVASEIAKLDPDIALLNEANVYNVWFNGGMNQVKWLAENTGLRYCEWQNVTPLGVGGQRVNGVISKYPLGPSTRIPIMRGNVETKYAMMDTSVVIDGQQHRLIALRFDAWNGVDNDAAHRQLAEYIDRIPGSVPIILGGDFNSDLRGLGLIDLHRNHGLTIYQETDGIDHIFFRGPYRVGAAELREVPMAASDHPMPFAQLDSVNAGPFTDGTLISTSDPVDELQVHVQQNALAADAVEFVLETAPSVTWRKEIVIAEGNGPGRWTIYTDGSRATDRNGLYTYQLPGGRLEFRKAKRFGRMESVLTIPIQGLNGGSRVIIRWAKDR
jgi:hypothetical protein